MVLRVDDVVVSVTNVVLKTVLMLGPWRICAVERRGGISGGAVSLTLGSGA